MELAYLLPIVGCAAMMGMMLWMMMRGNQNKTSDSAQARQPDSGTSEEIAMLRAEIAVLRAQQASTDSRSGLPTHTGRGTA